MEKIVKPHRTLIINSALSFPNYIIFFYFDEGFYQTWDVYNNKCLVKEGKIESNP